MDISLLNRPTANRGTKKPTGVDFSQLNRPVPFAPQEAINGDDDPKNPPLRRPMPTIQPTNMDNVELPSPSGLNRPAPVEVRERVVPEPTRPRIVAGAPMEEENAMSRLRRLINTKAQDENGRLKSGMWGTLNTPIQPTDSIGNAIGQRLGGFLTGLIKPESDEELQRQKDIASAQKEVAVEEEIAKQQREKETHDVDTEYKKTQTKVLAEKPATDQRKLDIQQKRDEVNAQYKQDLLNFKKETADALKAYREAIVDLKERGLDQNDEKIKQYQQRIDETIRHNKVTESQTDTKIASQERIAALRAGVQKQIADDRNKLSQDQFQKKYPGAGKKIPYSTLKSKYKDDADYHAEQAAKQGYEIDYDK